MRINPDYKSLNERFDAYAIPQNWCVDSQIGKDNSVHVWPLRDKFSHDLGGAAVIPMCKCSPVLEEQTSGVVLVIHQEVSPR